MSRFGSYPKKKPTLINKPKRFKACENHAKKKRIRCKACCEIFSALERYIMSNRAFGHDRKMFQEDIELAIKQAEYIYWKYAKLFYP